MRLFAALPLSDEIKETLRAVIDTLGQQGSGRFTCPENLHLTLAFIGDTDCVDAAAAAVSGLTVERFDLRLQGLGSFGSLLWAGIEPNPALASLAAQTQNYLRQAGFDIEEREFVPHITLVRGFVPFEEMLPQLILPQACMTAEKVCLMKSEHVDGRQVYTEVYVKNLL